MASHLSIGVATSESPLDSLSICVSTLLPGRDVGRQGCSIGDAPSDALAIKNADFNLSHVQPTGMFGGVVKLDSTQKGCCWGSTQDVYKGLSEMGVQIVENQMDATGLGVHRIHQVANKGHEIL